MEARRDGIKVNLTAKANGATPSQHASARIHPCWINCTLLLRTVIRGPTKFPMPRNHPQRAVVCIQTVWQLFGRQTTLNAATYCVLMSTVLAAQQWNGQVADTRDTVYRSDASCPLRADSSTSAALRTRRRTNDPREPSPTQAVW